MFSMGKTRMIELYAKESKIKLSYFDVIRDDRIVHIQIIDRFYHAMLCIARTINGVAR